MSIRTVALAATAILIAAPAFAATRHHKPDPILDHNGPISYSELQQIDSGSQGYSSRSSRKHTQTHVAAAASPDATAPSGADTTSAPSVANPADAVNPPAAVSTTPAPPPTSTGQLNTAPGESAGPTPIPSTPSSPTPPSTPQ